MKPRIPKNSGVIVSNPKKRKGTAKPTHQKYQLAPAVTKNAPDKNLQTSFQLIFIASASLNFRHRDQKKYPAPPAV
jgi:hypothetical protein